MTAKLANEVFASLSGFVESIPKDVYSAEGSVVFKEEAVGEEEDDSGKNACNLCPEVFGWKSG